jgi:hypothetical protein
MQVLLTSIGFTDFFRCLIFEFFIFTNADDLNKIRETNGSKIREQDSAQVWWENEKVCANSTQISSELFPISLILL